MHRICFYIVMALLMSYPASRAYAGEISMEQCVKIIQAKESSSELVKKAAVRLAGSNDNKYPKFIVDSLSASLLKKLSANQNQVTDPKSHYMQKFLIVLAKNPKAGAAFSLLINNKNFVSNVEYQRMYIYASGYSVSPSKEIYEFLGGIVEKEPYYILYVQPTAIKLNTKKSMEVIKRMHDISIDKKNGYGVLLRNDLLAHRKSTVVFNMLSGLILEEDRNTESRSYAIQALFSYRSKEWFRQPTHDTPKPPEWSEIDSELLHKYLVLADKVLKLELADELVEDVEGSKELIKKVLENRKATTSQHSK